MRSVLVVAFFIGAGVVIALILLGAFLLDRQDRRHGRRSTMRLPGRLNRRARYQARLGATSAPQGYFMNMEGLSSSYASEAPLEDAKNARHRNN